MSGRRAAAAGPRGGRSWAAPRAGWGRRPGGRGGAAPGWASAGAPRRPLGSRLPRALARGLRLPLVAGVSFPPLIWRGLGVAVAPGSPRDGSQRPFPARPRGETEQLGCAPRALGSPRCSERSPAPAAGTRVGAVGAQTRGGLGGCVPGRGLMLGTGSALALPLRPTPLGLGARAAF